MTKISKNIKQFRSDAGFTQEDLAEKLHVTRQTVSSWETNRTQPDIDMIAAIAGIFGISAEELIYGKKNKVGLEPAKKPDKKIFTTVLSVLGTLLTVTGLAIIFFRFWDELQFLKNILAFLPLVAGFGIALFALKKKPDSISWREGAGVAWTMGMAVTAHLVLTSLFPLMEFYEELLFDLVMVIPVMCLTKSLFPTGGYFFAVCFCTYCFGQDEFRGGLPGALTVVFGVLFYAAGVLFFSRYSFGDVRDRILSWIRLAALCVLFVIVISDLPYLWKPDMYSGSLSYLLALVTSLLFLYACSDRFDAPLSKELGAVALAFVPLLALPEYFRKLPAADVPLGLVCVLAAAACFVYCLLRHKSDKFRIFIAGTVFLNIAGSYMTQFLWKQPGVSYALKLAFCLAAAVLFIIKGVREAKITTANLGMLSVLYILIVTIIESEINVVVLGVTVAASGIILLLINKRMIRSFGISAAKTDGGETA